MTPLVYHELRNALLVNGIGDWRIGRFRVTIDAINEHTDVVRRVMSSVLVIDAEFLMSIRCIDYVGIGSAFAPREKGEDVPFYRIDFTSPTSWRWVQL